ncbi:DUF2326 domain-containing protein [Motiliproteus sp.]|uniref:DUF2326 domain-containing protein n=1 Tax=Motiliproteus sp. TaxID=1898955 RepID=UPI003BA85A09
MKISKIYSNKKAEFNDIEFNEEFNVVLAEIKIPENRGKDTHNLGKSKLMELIDYCLLKKRSNDFFLFKYFDTFKDFVFFLEFKLNSGGYLTVRRAVSKNTKISIKRHKEKHQDYRFSDESFWDYYDITIDKAKLILDAEFNLRRISPWDYRTATNYALRSQKDFGDIFKLSNFLGRHIYWKPYLGRVFGFNAEILERNYDLAKDIETYEDNLISLKEEVGHILGDEEEVLNSLLKVKIKEADDFQDKIDRFDFDKEDVEAINRLVEDIDSELSDLNSVRYYLSSNIKKLKDTVDKSNIDFRVSQAKRLFDEAGVLFEGQIEKTYSELIEFNEKITSERKGYVYSRIEELEENLEKVKAACKDLNLERSKKISYLGEMNTFDKYKEATGTLIKLRTEISELHRKLTLSEKIKEVNNKIREASTEKEYIVDCIRSNREEIIKSEESIYHAIKENFLDFVESVLDKIGYISTTQNGEGNLEFYAGIMSNKGEQTGESDGYSYKKILCMGYDLAVNLAYSDSQFIRFLYHDGGLETLDNRKKIEFLKYVRSVTKHSGIQYILTVIDTDLPPNFNFKDSEVAVRLHDDGYQGRLFKMKSW